AAEARAVGRVPVDALLALLAGVALHAHARRLGLREARRNAVVAGIGVLAAVAVDPAAESGDVVVAVLRLLRAVRAGAAPRIGRAQAGGVLAGRLAEAAARAGLGGVRSAGALLARVAVGRAGVGRGRGVARGRGFGWRVRDARVLVRRGGGVRAARRVGR